MTEISAEDWIFLDGECNRQATKAANSLKVSPDEFVNILPAVVEIIQKKKEIENIRGFATNTIKNLILAHRHKITDMQLSTASGVEIDDIADLPDNDKAAEMSTRRRWQRMHRRLCDKLMIEYDVEDTAEEIYFKIYQVLPNTKTFVKWRHFAGDTFLQLVENAKKHNVKVSAKSLRSSLSEVKSKYDTTRIYGKGVEDYIKRLFNKNPDMQMSEYLEHPGVLRRVPSSATRSAYWHKLHKKSQADNTN